MIRRHIIIVCLSTLLLVVTAKASPQSNTTAKPDLVAQSSGPSTGAEKPKIDSGTDLNADSAPKADPAPKPAPSAIEEELETLKARVADLEKQIANGAGSAASVPQRELEKTPGIPEAL